MAKPQSSHARDEPDRAALGGSPCRTGKGKVAILVRRVVSSYLPFGWWLPQNRAADWHAVAAISRVGGTKIAL